MAENSKIEWTTHTFNPWRGCTKVSPGCAHCYAETLSRRNPAVLGIWGPNGTRPVAAESAWHQPLKWNRAAEAAGERHRVFCASLADVFEDQLELDAPRLRLISLIHQTPHLDWLLLTKRPLFMRGWLAAHHHSWTPDMTGPPPNVWLGVSIEDQERADERIPMLLTTPAAVRFLSVEPLLGPVDLRHWLSPPCGGDVRSGHLCQLCHSWRCGLHWVIVGGESGGSARKCHFDWVLSIVWQCKAAGVACFVKQFGSRPISGNNERIQLGDRKGGDITEWPEALRVREFPKGR